MYDVSAWGEGTKSKQGIKKPGSFYDPTENLPPLLQEQRNGGNKVWNMDKAFEDEQLWRNYIGAYYALVTEIDHCFGEIFDALDEAGIEEETIIIYTSDHGDFVGNHGMVEKCASGHNVYEDILNIPLIIKYPGKTQKGARSAELVTLADVLPTLIEMLSLEVPRLRYEIQGESMANLLLANGSMNREYIVSEGWSQAAVISKDYKLGLMLDPGDHNRKLDYREFGNMFFDRTSDPLEVKNGINDFNNQDQITLLRSYYSKFQNNYPDIGKQQIIKARKNKN